MLEKIVPEQLPGGKYFAYTEEIRTQTRSVLTRFRQKVLCQVHEDKRVFSFSDKGDTGRYRKHTAETLSANLMKLVRCA